MITCILAEEKDFEIFSYLSDLIELELDLASDHNMAYRLLRVDLIKAVSTSVHPSFIITVTTDNLLLLFLLLITVYQFLLSNL